MAENKVQFGLKNVHYAVLTFTGTTPSWTTPVAVPGAVSLSLSPQGDQSTFYADNTSYYVSYSNNGYTGTLEMARFPDAMRTAIWGDTLGSTSKVLTETNTTTQTKFALLFEIDGDATQQHYVIYSCTASRPSIGSSTTNETTEPQTQSCDITAIALPDGKVSAHTTDTTPSGTVSAWYSAVFVEPAVYSVTANVTNGSATGATSISFGGTATVTIAADNGYNLPTTVTVTGATFSYDNTTGAVSLSVPTGNVTITAVCAS